LAILGSNPEILVVFEKPTSFTLFGGILGIFGEVIFFGWLVVGSFLWISGLPIIFHVFYAVDFSPAFEQR